MTLPTRGREIGESAVWSYQSSLKTKKKRRKGREGICRNKKSEGAAQRERTTGRKGGGRKLAGSPGYRKPYLPKGQRITTHITGCQKKSREHEPKSKYGWEFSQSNLKLKKESQKQENIFGARQVDEQGWGRTTTCQEGRVKGDSRKKIRPFKRLHRGDR